LVGLGAFIAPLFMASFDISRCTNMNFIPTMVTKGPTIGFLQE
jgi:hypothetical protein